MTSAPQGREATVLNKCHIPFCFKEDMGMAVGKWIKNRQDLASGCNICSFRVW